MPEEPFIYYEEEPERGEPRYADIELSQDDIKLLAKVVWVEAQGECAEGQQAAQGQNHGPRRAYAGENEKHGQNQAVCDQKSIGKFLRIYCGT